MRIFLLSLLLLLSYRILADQGKCSPNSFIIQNDEEEKNHCDESIIYSIDGLPRFPEDGTRQLTFVISLAQSSECEDVNGLPVFGITIKPDGDASPEQQIVEFRSPQGPEQVNPMDVYTTDRFGVPKLVTSAPFDMDHWNRIVVSIDLEKNIFSTQFLSEDGMFTKTLTTLDYSDWAFDDTIQIYLGQSNGNGSPAATMMWRSFAFDYAFYSENELYHFIFQGNDVIRRGFYSLYEDGTSKLEDNSGVEKKKSFGVLSRGQAPSDTQNTITTLGSSQFGVNFTETTQYLAFDSLPKTASVGHVYILPVSFTISFWIRLSELPNTAEYLVRRSNSQNADVFALKLKPDGKIVGVMNKRVITTTTEGLKVNQWTFVTAFFTVSRANLNKEATVIIHFWDTLVTPNATQTLSNLLGQYKESATDTFRIGGFKGVINDIQFFSPGAAVVNSPPCSTDLECKLTLGYDYSQCLVTNCPKGTYYDGDSSCVACDASCRTCTGPGPNACDSLGPATVSTPTTTTETTPGTTTTGTAIGSEPTPGEVTEMVSGNMPESGHAGTVTETETITVEKSRGLTRAEIFGIVVACVVIVIALLYVLKRTVYIPYMTKLRSKEKYASSGAPGSEQLPEPPTPATPITPASPLDTIPLTTNQNVQKPPTPEKNLASQILKV